MARICPKCHLELQDRSKFCPNCGATVPPGPAATARIDAGGEAALAAAPVTVPSMPAVAPPASRPAGEPAGEPAGKPEPRRKAFAPGTHSLVGPHEQAGFGLRFGALLFDLLFLMIGWMAMTFVISYRSNKSIFSSNTTLAAVYGVALALYLVNFVLIAGVSGQTLGKRLIGVRIVREDGAPFGIGGAALRHTAGYLLSALGAFLGYVWILWDPKQQGWHDKLARTLVVLVN